MPQLPVYNRLGSPFIELQSVDSTNNYALQQTHAGLAQHGAVFFAHEQIAGRGQRGRAWTSERGANLIMSAVINPSPLPVSQQFHLSACVALSVCRFFERYAGDATRIKWPNDLYWHDRKAGGILIENIIRESGPEKTNWPWSVAGIGINLNQHSFPENLRNPVSLKQITGKTFDPPTMARELCDILNEHILQLNKEGFNAIYLHYLDRLYKRNEYVTLRQGTRRFEAQIKGVSTAGKLLVGNGMEEEFSFGEIEWLIS